MTQASVQNLMVRCLPKLRLSQIKTLAWAIFRGFHRTALVRALSEKYGIDFVIRVIKTTHVKLKGHQGALGDLRVQTGKVRDFRQAALGLFGTGLCTVGCEKDQSKTPSQG